MSNDRNIKTNEEKRDSLLATKESIAAAGILFSSLALLILCTRSFIFGDLGLAVHSFLTGMFGYLAYPLIVGCLYLSVMTLIGKHLVRNRRLFTLLCLTLLSASFIVHASLTFGWSQEGYIAACFTAGETFPNTTVAGGIGGIIVFGVTVVLSNIGAIVFFSALTLFLGYLTVVTMMKPELERPVAQVAQKAEVQAPVQNVQQPSASMTAPSMAYSDMQNVVQHPAFTLREEQPVQPRMETYVSPTGGFSPFGAATPPESQEEPPTPVYGRGNSRELLFNATPADNYKTNLIFDPNSSANKRPAVDPAELATGFTPSYTEAYEDSVNEETAFERPAMVVNDNTYREPPVLEQEEQPLPKMQYLAEERPSSIEPTVYPSYDTSPTPLAERYTAPTQPEEVDFKKLREESAREQADQGYRRHEYMDMFSPSNPRLFEDQNDPFERSREERFPERIDREIPEARNEFSHRNEFLEETRDTFRARETEERGRDGLNIFDEPADDPYKLRTEYEEKPEPLKERGAERSAFGFGNEDTVPMSRSVPEPPKAVMPPRDPTAKKEEVSKPQKPRVIKPYKRIPLDDFDCRDIEPTQNETEVEETKQNIIAILEEFKVTGATVASVSFGPTVTRYNIALPRNISPQKVVSLDQSISLALRSSGISIYPNYEDGVVSIEIPNKQRQFVKLGCMLSGNTFVNSSSSSLMFAIGKNVANAKVYGDISKMIHMLVAGSSGSGKSVFLGSLIISLIYKYSPEELRLILIDPKKTEFVLYNNLPHLMINEIITDANKTVQSLNWAIGEMNRRYGLFEQMSRAGTYVVNLDEYNAQLIKRGQKNERLPKIVIIIDELADLMLAAKKEIEDRIQNLTQKARAAGIHLIVATQRPSTDVITGVIKSNLSTRIAFGVATDVDSRVILDQSGAQKLLGKGDMLYVMPGINTPVRVQSAFISPEESQRVVNFIKENNEAYYDEEATAFINNTRTGGDDPSTGDKGEIDPMYIEALRHVILSGSASISMIQRKCSAGYNRAGRIIEWMEEMGYISAFDGAKARKVLITKEDFESMYGPL